MNTVTSLEWVAGKVRFLDQTRLPGEERFVETDDDQVVAQSIRTLAIRGAPLIGIAAAYAVVLASNKLHDDPPSKLAATLDKVINLLAGTRPTAVNLFWALDRQRKVLERNVSRGIGILRKELLSEAVRIHEEDSAMCREIGKHGAAILPNAACVLTHCNTGALATGGIGTALGIILTSWEQHKLKHVYIDETRPLFQGARLTAWEVQRAGIPSTLITDNTAGFLMQQGIVNVVVVGADRIAANGDVANKVGTYGLAVLARHHGIPMLVAAPTSSVDFEMPAGSGIPIEQRSGREVTDPFGVPVAPRDTEVYSPAFDITPAELITAIVTEAGVLRPPYRKSIAGIKRPEES